MLPASPSQHRASAILFPSSLPAIQRRPIATSRHKLHLSFCPPPSALIPPPFLHLPLSSTTRAASASAPAWSPFAFLARLPPGARGVRIDIPRLQLDRLRGIRNGLVKVPLVQPSPAPAAVSRGIF